MDDAAIAEWAAAAPDRRWRWALFLPSFAALVVSVFSVGADYCGAVGPEPCTPTPLAMLVVLALAPPFLAGARPGMAAVFALVFGVVELWDPIPAAQIAWPLVALLHLAHLGYVQRCRSRQRAVAARWSAPVRVNSRMPMVGAEGHPRRTLLLAGVVTTLAAAATSWSFYDRAVDRDAARSDRALAVDATVVTEEDDDLEQLVRLDDPPQGFPVDVSITFVGYPEVGDRIELMIDPEDPGWTHPVREPPDHTWWLMVAATGVLLAVLFSERLLVALWHRRRLREVLAAYPLKGVPVRGQVLTSGGVHLVSTTSGLPMAAFTAAGSVAADPDGLRTVHLVGDVRRGGWAAMVTPSGIVLPWSALRPHSGGARRAADRIEEDA